MAGPALPSIRIKNADTDAYIDYLWSNDLGGDLLKTSECGPLRNGAAMGGRCDISIVPGSINVGLKTCTIRRVWRNSANALLLNSAWNDVNGDVSGVLLDGSTAYENLIPGWLVVFNDVAVGIVDTHTAHITQGDYLGAFADGNPDAAIPGEPVYEQRLKFVNNGATIEKIVTLYNRPKRVYRVRAGNGGLDDVRVTNNAPVAKIVGDVLSPYKGTFNGLSGGLINMLIDGAVVPTLIRLLNNATVDSSSMHVGERYRFTSTGLSGVQITIAADVTNADRFNILIWDPDPVEIAADNSGDPVLYGPDDILVGDLDPGDIGYGWVRVSANIGSGNYNPVMTTVGVTYLETGAAAIDED